MNVEVLAMWSAVTLYALAAVGFVLGFVFRWERALVLALAASVLGVIVHAVGLGARWVSIGRPPILGFYEVVSVYAFVAVVMFLVISWRWPGLRIVGVVLMPVAFLFIAGAMLAPKTVSPITPMLAGWWLTIHVVFAHLTFAAFIVSFGLGVLTLLRSHGQTARFAATDSRLPPPETIDDLTFRFVAAGFIFLGIMTVSGAIWANEAWGRYWGWDPIETWSLVAWLIYAAVLHLRLVMRWRDDRFAWAVVAALPVVLFALLGVPVFYKSIHGAYLTGTGG